MVEYMRIFSILPFILMLIYLLSPFFKIPLLNNFNSKKYQDKKLEAGGKEKKQ
jgi:archaetidylserine synthase